MRQFSVHVVISNSFSALVFTYSHPLCSATSTAYNFMTSRRLALGKSRWLQDGAGNGAGIANKGNVNLLSVRFKNCSAIRRGGGLYNVGNATLVDCLFTGNRAQAGSAIFIGSGTNMEVRGTDFRNNTAEFGGDIFVATGGLTTGCGNKNIPDQTLTDPCVKASAGRRHSQLSWWSVCAATLACIAVYLI
jgi:hypothetical protein